MTANQLVAYNLRRARELRELTQEEAAELLEPYLGVRWSKGSFSAAERSVAGERTREFSADELLAFSAAFDLPVTWFFLPPGDANDKMPSKITLGGRKAVKTGELIDRLFETDPMPIGERLRILFAALPPELRTEAQGKQFDYATAAAAGIYDAAIKDLIGGADYFQRVAELFKDFEAAAGRTREKARRRATAPEKEKARAPSAPERRHHG